MPYRNAGRQVAASLGLGLITLVVSAASAGAVSTQQNVTARSQASAIRASSAAGTGGAGLGGSSTTKANATGGGGTGISATKLHLGDRTLKQGMQGRDVRVLQDYLSRVGYQTGVDGDFGPGTARSVRAFQRAHGFKADGVVTLAVANALRAAVAKRQKSAGGPVGKGHLNADGTATPPANAPTAIKKLFAAANRIASTPYIYGGGHATWNDSGYDCSGSLSYALHGANMLDSPMDSSELESYGSPGPGHWITIWANSGHTYMYVAGLRYDTSAQDSTGGSRWTRQPRSNSGFVERHPTGW